MNVFVPYDRAPSHEDQLTRAFLIVLKAVPLAHAAWLELVSRAHRQAGGEPPIPSLHELPTAELRTQIGSLPTQTARLISLLQTDEVFTAAEELEKSDRRQVLDGLVTYGTELAIAFENKPSVHDVRPDQLRVNLGAESSEIHDPTLACVPWSEVIQTWNRLLDAGHLGVAETTLVSDFLDLVEEYFPSLLPYATVRSCGTNPERLRRRCRRLLEEIGGQDAVKYHRGWSWFLELPGGQAASRLALMPVMKGEGGSLQLEVAAGDTIAQGKVLYSRDWPRELDAMMDSGWSVSPNFHFAFLSSNLHWTRSRLTAPEYWRYWRGAARDTWLRQVKRPDYKNLLSALLDAGVASEDDRAAFQKVFSNTNRDTVNVCPGLTLKYSVPLEEAARLDERRQLAAFIAARFAEVERALDLRR